MRTLSYSLQAIKELKEIITHQSQTIQTVNENMGLIRIELTNLQRRVYDINSRLVEVEEDMDKLIASKGKK